MTPPHIAALRWTATDLEHNGLPGHAANVNAAADALEHVRRLFAGNCPTCGLNKQPIVMTHAEPDPDVYITIERHNAIVKDLTK